MSQGQVFLNEFFASFVLLYLAYGVGLDPRQAVLFGPLLGPLLVGAALGLVIFATSGIAPGYAGAQMMPTRCFAYGIVRRDLSGMLISRRLETARSLTVWQINGYGGLGRLRLR